MAAVKGPFSWSSIMPTGGVEPTEESLKVWFNAGVHCVGMGSKLFVKDANGNVLADGDAVVLIKDLKLGGSEVLKGGSKSRPIRLVDGDHEISCKVNGIAVGLKACFVKKA